GPAGSGKLRNADPDSFNTRAPVKLLVNPALAVLVFVSAAILASLPARAADAEGSPFDGKWEVVLDCPPYDADDDDARGYTQRFAAEVKTGEFRGVHGKEG